MCFNIDYLFQIDDKIDQNNDADNDMCIDEGK